MPVRIGPRCVLSVAVGVLSETLQITRMAFFERQVEDAVGN